MSFIVNFLVFALVLSIIVIVHELGHLITAKKIGVYCNEFSIGMGPKIYSYQSKKSETAYSLRALPIGGYVMMAGEAEASDLVDVPFERTINGIARWKRLIVMLAGIFMNMVLAFVVFATIFSMNGVIREPKPIIANVVEGYPAADAGLKKDDEIISLTFSDGSTIHPKTFTEASFGIMTFKGSPIEFEVKRGSELLKITVTPVKDPNSDNYVIGINSPQGELEKVGFFETLQFTAGFLVNMVGQIFQSLKWLVRGKGLDNVGGPIAIFKITSEVTSSGFNFLYFWNLIGSLSVSLAVMNLLPIPIFDGGRALLTIIEMIIRKPIPEKIENFVMMVGFIFVILLMGFFIFNDIRNF